MRIASLSLLFVVMALGGCIFTQPPTPPIQPPPQPTNAVDRIEGDFLIAERSWPTSERACSEGQTITITLSVTAKRNLEYVFWREIIGGYAVNDVNSTSDLEFIVLHIPAGKSYKWSYDLICIKKGIDTLDGVIKSASGPYSEDLRIKAKVEVR